MLEVFDSFVKSEHDKCNYRLITLPNKLQAMLVSDPKLEKVRNVMKEELLLLFTCFSLLYRPVRHWTFILVLDTMQMDE